MTIPVRTGTLSTKSSGSGAASIDISGVTDGSWILLVAHAGNTSTSLTGPSGWTNLGSGPFTIGSRRYWLYGRIKESGDTCSLTKGGSLAVTLGLAYGTGADAVANWTIGTAANRAGGSPHTSTTAVATSINTTVTDTLALAVACEATSAEDTSAPVVSGTGWNPWLYVTDTASPDTTNIEQIHIAYKDMASTGATGNMTVTYQNSQASNAGGIQVGITPGAPANSPPTAAFTHDQIWLHVEVDGTGSTDADGTISSYSWDWGDGSTDTTGSTSDHDYAGPGTYTITLTVTDDDSATDTQEHDVTVEANPVLFLGDEPITGAWLGDKKITKAYLGPTLVKSWVFTVDDMLAMSEIQVAWRGLGGTYTEMTPAGYAAAVAAGFKVLECSVHYSSDGVPVLIHDATVNAMTTSTGNVADMTWATLQGLTVDQGSGGDGQLHRLEEILDLYAGNYVLFIDDKTNTHTADMLALLDTYPDPQQHFVWKGFRGWSPAADDWTAEGYEAWGIYYDDEMDGPHTSLTHFTMLGLNHDADQSNWDIGLATGKRVFGHVIQNTTNANTARSKGATGLMTGVVL